jgi:CIC family chloride channel protein
LDDRFFDSESLTFAGGAIALLVATIVVLGLLLPLTRARLRRPKINQPRQQRLGIADAFAFDRQRQLVIIQRDNVQHLVLIGGPNDLVIEADAVGVDMGEIGAAAASDQTFDDAEPRQPAQAAGEGFRATGQWLASASARARKKLAKSLSKGSDLLPLALLAGIAGAGAGLVGGLFRLALRQADNFRISMPLRWHDQPLLGCLLMIGGAAIATALGVWLVRHFMQYAAGSGIPHVEAVIDGELPPAPLILLPVKFAGGLLAIGAGLALGREGPSVQMGATLAYHLGKISGRNRTDCRSLLAAGAGAGLAAAFNAPLAGSAFVLEELVRRFDVRDAVAAIGASGSAIVVARLLTGPAPDFVIATLPYPAFGDNLLCFALGGVAGVLGALALADRLAGWPAELRAAMIGAAIGALAWFAPDLAGGGDVLTQQTLEGADTLAVIPFLYLLRLILGAASYATGVPGGLFAPLLVLGAQMGFFFGGLWHSGAAEPSSHAIAFAAVGMAAFFTAVVRAPLTGIILVTEMTASSTLLLPMLAACFSAMAVATLLGEPPIYDALKQRTLKLSG